MKQKFDFKVVILMIVMLLSSIATVSATSKVADLVKDGTMWVGEVQETALASGQIKYHRWISYIDGTSTINGKEYMRLYRVKALSPDKDFLFTVPPISEIGHLGALLRVEDGKVYVLNLVKSDIPVGDEYLYYDFNIEEGDVCEVNTYVFYISYQSRFDTVVTHAKCLGRGTVKSCGNTYDVIYIDYLDANYEPKPCDFWVDGIGSNREWDGMGNIHKRTIGSGMIDYVVVDGEIVYKTSDFIEENMTIPDFSKYNNVEGIDEERAMPKTVYTIDGKKSNISDPGLKIVDGKKLLTK
jgi:hypothetical protein